MSDPYPKLVGLLSRATQELFQHNGLIVVPSAMRGEPPKGRQVLGMVGFGGVDMRGTLAILADETFWRKIAPPVLPESDPILADMVGEFANMLLGKVRNAILPLGADVATAIPSALCGTDLALHRTSVARPDWHVFDSDNGPFFVRLHVAFRKDFRFVEDSPWSVRPSHSDLVLF